MRSEHQGQEVAARAVWPIVDSMQAAGIDTTRLPSIDQLSEPSFRISWDQLLSILSVAEAHFDEAQLKAVGAAVLTAPHYASKIRVARRLLTLEDAYRFFVYPHRTLEYTCLQSAVLAEAGSVRITSILQPDYAPSNSLFLILLGAVQALAKLYGAQDAEVSGDITRRYMHFEMHYTPSMAASSPLKRRVSRWLRTAYCALNKTQADDQLIRRTLALETALKQRDEARTTLSLERIDQKRRMANMTEVVAEYDHLNQLIYLSPNGEKVFGYPNNVLQDNPFQILHPKDRPAAEGFFANPRAFPNGIYAMQGVHANGAVLDLEVAIHHFDNRDTQAQWSVTFRDLSARELSVDPSITAKPPIRSQAKQTIAEAASAQTPKPHDASMPTLLLADDDEITRRITAKILHHAGFNVVCVGDGTSVLNELNQTTVACLVLDINMPGLTGLEVYEQIQARDIVTPVVFVSGDTSQLSAKYPTLPSVHKPFRSEHLIEVIREVLAA